MADKIGVYICEGCDIGSNLDCAALGGAVTKKFSAICPVVTTVPVLCSPEGVARVQADIDSGAVNGVALCACSPRAKWDVFSFEKVQISRVNLREGVVWAIEDTDEMQNMATDYMLMGVRQVEKSAAPEPELSEMHKTILVLGGGFTGMTAALEAAKAGQSVVLLEKEAELGGFAKKLYKTIPLTPPYAKAADTGVDALIAAVESNPKIKVYKASRLAALNGSPGMYDAVIAGTSGEATEQIGAVVLATGWLPQDMSIYEPFGFGKFKNVISSVDFEAMAKSGKLLRPSDGKPVESVAFVMQGPRPAFAPGEASIPCNLEPPAAAEGEKKEGDAPEEKKFVQQDMESIRHLAYSSGLSPAIALKQAGYVRELAPNALAFVFYENMNVPGIFELYYKAAQDDPGIMLSKGDVREVAEAEDGALLLSVANSLLGGDIEVKADLLVLSTGMVPTTAKDPVMNFVYRQGPAFPDLLLFDGFTDSNYICFPYETRRTGVYAAGNVRQPMFMDQCADDAAGAALKAIQCIHSANHGVAVHPRSLDNSYPKFNFVRCTQCKRCTEECPFGALDDDEKGTPKPNPTRCRRCGTCMGACPERVISFDTYNVDQIGSMIKEIKVPENMDEGGPRVVILACENDAYPALDMAAMRKLKWNKYVRVIPVRCLGSVNAIWVADAMSKGVDGFMLLGCKYGDDYQCHFVKGSEICNRRKTNIAETLSRLGIEADRVELFQVAIDEYDKVPDIIGNFVEMILTKGPNPFKGY